jgi:hypothetical protein
MSGALLIALSLLAPPLRAQGHEMATMPTHGAWRFSAHGSASLLHVDEGTKRGDTQLAVADWEMFMAMRPLRGGTLRLQAMTSATQFVMGGKGAPQLLQTGGTYRHAWVHDRMHPPTAIMGLDANYDYPISSTYAMTGYLGAVGQPALGPVPYMHRKSAENDPFSPLGHHWQDATHQSFGVVTLGVTLNRIKIEGSAFNAREADETHPVVDYRGAKLDSYAGRLTWAINASFTATGWTGFLNEPHRLDPTTRMHRMGASLTANVEGIAEGRWTTTAIWGMNVHHHGAGSHLLLHAAPGASPHHESRSALLETNLEIGERTAVFARVETVEKNGEELGFLGGDLTVLYPIQSAVLGATRTFATVWGIDIGAGARGEMNFVPKDLRATYDTRRPSGATVFMRLGVR